VRLNEVLANCIRGTNQQGTVIAWIELYNSSGSVIDLSDFSLSDSDTQPRRYVFPANTIIPPAGFLVVNCGTNATRPGLYTGFKFQPCGGSVFLYDTRARLGALLDPLHYGLQAADYSVGRVPYGGSNWVLTVPTPGAVNMAAPLGPPQVLRLNEWMAVNTFTLRDPIDGYYDDWIEIYNPTNLPIALGGLYFTDTINVATKHQIPPLSFIGTGANGAYAVFFADATAQRADHLNFKISASGEYLALYNADLTVIDEVMTRMPPADIAEGRLPDGSTNTILFLPQTQGLTASPGAPNPLPSILAIGDSTSVIQLKFTIQSNLSCTVQYQDGYLAAWNNLTNISPALTNRELLIRDAQPAVGARFYRISR
jgi:hypothetical protein